MQDEPACRAEPLRSLARQERGHALLLIWGVAIGVFALVWSWWCQRPFLGQSADFWRGFPIGISVALVVGGVVLTLQRRLLERRPRS